ncbi:MAG: COX15/CtaA family protein [Saprospiraceae bacterium]
MKPAKQKDNRIISAWLFAGVILVFVQILLGGVTRLTGSGLSITRWEIVTGAIPPMNQAQWIEAFDLYKATPQYQKINEGMELKHFKFIFFWEYIHRLWARMMGFIFLIPFLIFWFRKSISPWLLRRLFVVVLLAALAAVFGWIMVASGLIDHPWVNAYKLTIHLGLGIALFIYLFFTWLTYRGYEKTPLQEKWSRRVQGVIILALIQIGFGGFMSGMKAALIYPTWPKMNNSWFPGILMDKKHWNFNTLLMYEKSGFMPAMIQFIHRNLAYLLALLILLLSYWLVGVLDKRWYWVLFVLVGIIVVQIGLGITTLLGSVGSIPVLYASLHQGLGILFLTYLFYIHKIIQPDNIK